MTSRPPLRLAACLLCAAAAALPAYAERADYRLDPVHTRVLLAVEHAGFSKALGTVSGSTGTLRFDPDDWSTAQLEVSVPLRNLDLGDQKWNEATLARNLLDAEKFPTATFVSNHVEPLGPDRASVVGTLTLRGVSKEIALDVTLNALKRHPLPPFRRTAGFSATTVLSRAEFGIDAWKSMIGDRVELRMEVEATRTRQGDADDADDDADEKSDAEPAAIDSEQPAPVPPLEPTP